MTHRTVTDPQASFDLPLQAARDRIAELQASTDPASSPATDATPARRRGPFATLRDALGTRLVAVGGALIADEALRQRIVRS
jgi:hypothetical protein